MLGPWRWSGGVEFQASSSCFRGRSSAGVDSPSVASKSYSPGPRTWARSLRRHRVALSSPVPGYAPLPDDHPRAHPRRSRDVARPRDVAEQAPAPRQRQGHAALERRCQRPGAGEQRGVLPQPRRLEAPLGRHRRLRGWRRHRALAALLAPERSGVWLCAGRALPHRRSSQRSGDGVLPLRRGAGDGRRLDRRRLGGRGGRRFVPGQLDRCPCARRYRSALWRLLRLP